MFLSLHEKMRIRSQILNETGKLPNDAEIVAYAKSEATSLQQNALAAQQATQDIKLLPGEEPDTRNIGEMAIENTFDLIGGALWSAADTALFGAPGMVWRATDRDSYNAAMSE